VCDCRFTDVLDRECQLVVEPAIAPRVRRALAPRRRETPAPHRLERHHAWASRGIAFRLTPPAKCASRNGSCSKLRARIWPRALPRWPGRSRCRLPNDHLLP
jgi:hypothetical protein